MIKHFKKFTFGTMIMFTVATTAGCVPLLVGAAAGAGSIVYVKGALVQNLDEPVEKVHKASLAALKEMGLFVSSDELSRHSAVINAEYENGEKIKISIKALTGYVSEISIRIGVIGDQEDSRLILSAIEKEL